MSHTGLFPGGALFFWRNSKYGSNADGTEYNGKEDAAPGVGSTAAINGSLELLPLCNMNCDMCYVRLSARETEAKGGLHTADEWIGLGREMQKAGVLFLLLTGGEPLLFPDFQKLYVELRQMGMILTVNTNGTLLDEGWADFFGRYKPRRINITLYGADDSAYEKLCHYPGE